MRSHACVYVDAGYLLASAATLVTGTSFRNGIHVEFAALIEALINRAEEISGLPVLRVHWYDSARDGVPDMQQTRIGELPKVKLRLGRFGYDGQQKGVDLRIGLDLGAHARNRAADVLFLVSGDDDLSEAVEEAQVHGVEVDLLVVPNAAGQPHGVSKHLIRAVDSVHLIDAAMIDQTTLRVDATQPSPTTVTPAPAAPTPLSVGGKSAVAKPPSQSRPPEARGPAVTSGSTLVYSSDSTSGVRSEFQYRADADYDEDIDRVARNVLESFRKSKTDSEFEDLVRSRPTIPREVDRALLIDLCDAIGIYDLSDSLRHRLRNRFWEVAEAW